MPLITHAPIYFARLDPARPNERYDKENPKWEVQMRTSDYAQVEELRDLGIKMRMIVHKEGAPQEGEPVLNDAGEKQWRFNFKKGSIKGPKQGGGPADPPTVVDGDLNPIDPTTIGNGTIANLDVFQYGYGEGKTACVLMGVQITKLMYYKQKVQGFAKADQEPTEYAEGQAPGYDEHESPKDDSPITPDEPAEANSATPVETPEPVADPTDAGLAPPSEDASSTPSVPSF